MKKLYTYILRSFIGTFIFTFFVAVFILLMQFLWCYLDDLVGKGLGFDVLGKLMFYTSITFVPMAMPLAILLSSLMCFGNLGEFYELVAMKASGISVWKIMRPLLIFSIVMSLVAFVFSNNVLPVATLKSKVLLRDVRKQKMSFDIPEGRFYKGIDGYTIRAGKKGADGNTLYDLMIYDHTEYKGNIKVTTADSATMALSPNQTEIIFTLYDGFNYSEVVDDKDYKIKRPFEKMEFRKQLISFDISDFNMTESDESTMKGHQSMLNLSQLVTAIDSLEMNSQERLESYKNSFKNRMQHLSSKHNVKNDKKKHAELDTITVFKWPLLENFSEKEQQSIVNMAITATKNQVDNIDINIKDFERQETNIRKHKQVMHEKFSLSIACLLFFFIGAPLGAIIRKGGLGLPIVISVIFFVIYYVITITSQRIAIAGDIPVFLGVWMSSIIILPIGVFLTIKATTDSALLDGESWKKTFNKIFKRDKKR
ncbi:MAG: LptF/LptG family permease [Bacteroidales bacterium]|nr:LptF/LptG family permease [Bacteroidales bacterium]